MRSSFRAAVLLSLVLVPLRAQAACADVEGDFEAVDVPCTESPLLLCIDGDFAGEFEASYVGAFETLAPAPTLAQPLRLAYTSSDTFTTSSETLTGTTSGHIVLNDTVAALVCVIGCAADAACLAGCVTTHAGTAFSSSTVLDGGRGSLDASGTGSYLDGVSRGTYSGEVCE